MLVVSDDKKGESRAAPPAPNKAPTLFWRRALVRAGTTRLA
jgi:hypothetical protein